MKCLECKIAKYDKAANKWICPAHPWAELDLYTEHRNCGANRWYPAYVKDRVEVVRVKAQNYVAFSLVISRALEDGKRCHLPENMLEELNTLQSKSNLRSKMISQEYELLVYERERLKKNGLI